MARFNSPTVGTKTTNVAGGEAYKQSDKLELVSILLTSFVQDQYYEKASDTVKRIAALIKSQNDKLFCAKAAVFARKEFGMRSVSHVVAGEIARTVKGEAWTRRFFDKVIRRVDDMMEVVSYYASTGSLHPLPNALKKGLRDAIARFDEYQLAKYRGEGKAVKLVDLVNLVHPARNSALDKLVKGELKSKETWETKLTQAGQKAKTKEQKEELKKAAWGELLKSKKLGYFALLRNLRNIIEQSPENVDLALEQLQDEKAIRKSLVLPFRFQTAMEELSKVGLLTGRKVLAAISKAMDLSVQNCPELPGRTLIALDESGSMAGRAIEIGSLFAAALYKRNDSMLLSFSENARFRNVNPQDSTSSICRMLCQDMGSAGTNFHSIFERITGKFDRIIILSDMQGWMTSSGGFSYSYGNPSQSFADYKKRTGADPHVYSFDLQGYGSMMFPERNVYCLAGFSEKVFDIMKLLEQDRNALVHRIEAVEI